MSTEVSNRKSITSQGADVTEGSPQTVPLPDRSTYMVFPDVQRGYTQTVVSGGTSSAIILPRWIYIKDRQGRYLTVRAGPQNATLTFRAGAPDLDCAFETFRNWASWFQLLGRNGNHIMRYNNSAGERWYSADPVNPISLPTFHFIPARANAVYLQDNLAPHRFMSNQLMSSGAPIARDFINQDSEMEISIAAVRNEIIDVRYDIPGGVVREVPPLIALSTSVRNDSHGDVNQTLTYSYEKWAVGTWNNSGGIELGVTSSFRVGVPFIASARFEISVSASFTHEWGGEEGVRELISSSTTITVPPRKRARATIVVRNAQIDVGFTYTHRVLWSNGQSQDIRQTGIYTNVDSWHVDVVLDDWEDV